MKVIYINRRKVGVALVLVGLMIVLMMLENQFHDKLKMTVFTQNNINSLQEYEGLNGELSYKLPEGWNNKERSFDSEKILYHSEFYNKDMNITGYIQIQNKDAQLQDVMNEINTNYNDKEDVEKYNYQPIKVNSSQGYIINYKTKLYDNSNVKVYKYFVDNDKVYTKFTFYVREDGFKDNMPRIFNSIVSLVEFK